MNCSARELLAFRCALARERVEQESPGLRLVLFFAVKLILCVFVASSLPEYADESVGLDDLPESITVACVMPGDARKTLKMQPKLSALDARDQLFEKYQAMSGNAAEANDFGTNCV